MDFVDSNNSISQHCCLEKVKLEDASKELGVSCRTLRSWLKYKVVPIGIAHKQEGAQKWQYVIYREWLDKYKESMNVPC